MAKEIEIKLFNKKIISIDIKDECYKPICKYFLENKENGCQKQPIYDDGNKFLGYLACRVINCEYKKKNIRG